MKINGLQPRDIYESFASSAVRGGVGGTAKKAPSGMSADRVEISSEGSDINEARRLLEQSDIDATPADATSADATSADARSEKIESLKEMINSGEYNVPAEDVAKSILNGRLLDSRA